MDAVASREQGWSPLKYVLLCLLRHKPAHGYELTNSLARRLGGDWAVNRRSIYRMLEAFEREGLAVSDRSDRANPDRNIYTATAAAEAIAARWMGSANADSEEQQMKELQAKLAVACQQDLPALLVTIDEYERRGFAARRGLEQELPPRSSPARSTLQIAREEKLDQLNAHLVSLSRVRGRVRELMPRPDGPR